MRFEFIQLIPSLAFVEIHEFLRPRIDALALLLIFTEGLVFRGTAVPEGVDEMFGLALEGLLAELYQQSLIFRRELEQWAVLEGRRRRGFGR